LTSHPRSGTGQSLYYDRNRSFSPQATLDGVPHGAGRLRLAVVLPTLNERKNLRKLVARLDEALGDIGWEAIFVDDNSPDGTADEARAINQEDPRIRVIQRIGRRGLASAAIEGMCSTAAPVVAVMDADHQHDPKLLPQMLAAIESGDYDVAYASRFAEGASTEAWGRPDRVKASGFANALARKVTGVDLSDPMSGYFMLRGETLRADADNLSGVGFKILLDILATVDALARQGVPSTSPLAQRAKANWIAPSCSNSLSAFMTSGWATSSPPALRCSARWARWA
jgi:dolichol-phosphate mannosyltransferase